MNSPRIRVRGARKEAAIQCLKKIIEMMERDHYYSGGMMFSQTSETSLAFTADVVFSTVPPEKVQ